MNGLHFYKILMNFPEQLQEKKDRLTRYMKQINRMLERSGNEECYRYVNDEINALCDRLAKKTSRSKKDKVPKDYIWQESFAYEELKKIFGDITIPKLRTKADLLAKYFQLPFTKAVRNHVEELIFWFEIHWNTFMPVFQIPNFEAYLVKMMSQNDSGEYQKEDGRINERELLFGHKELIDY